MSPTTRISNKTLKVRVIAQEAPKDFEWEELAAYLFGSSGRFLAQAPIIPSKREGDKGSATFELPNVRARTLLVKVGPKARHPRMLHRMALEVARVLVTPAGALKATVEIPRKKWALWLSRSYQVIGQVDVRRDGDTMLLRDGEVDIYDVDPGCFYRLPDPVVEKLRVLLLDLHLDPPRIQQPKTLLADSGQILRTRSIWNPVAAFDPDWICGNGPRPIPSWDVFEESFSRWLGRADHHSMQRFSVDPVSIQHRMDTLSISKRGNAEAPRTLMGVDLGFEVTDLLHLSPDQIRRWMVEGMPEIRRLFCFPWIYWPIWVYCRAYSTTLLGSAEIREDGSFQKIVRIYRDQEMSPDLWFVVRQKIDGIDREIYSQKPIYCHTYWDHPSGKPVHLHVTDPEAVTQQEEVEPDEGGVYVMPLGIGRDSWHEINFHYWGGHSDHTEYQAKGGQFRGTDPYGSRLELRMQLHDDLRDRGVHWYRWSYRLEGTAYDAWMPIRTPITHRYLEEVDDELFLLSHTLGPKNVGEQGGLFEVPDPDKEWIVAGRSDLAYAVWDTTQRVPNGRYMLKLEMFDADGKLVRPSDSTFRYFLAQGPASEGVVPVDTSPPGVQAEGGLIFRVHVDNTPAEADVLSMSLDGSPVNECQFIEYRNRGQDEVKVKLIADHHRAGYAYRDFLERYSLRIVRGASGTPVASMDHDFSADTSTGRERTHSFPVSDLLGEKYGKGPFDRCSFAVRLRVYPTIRDGYGRIRAYEAGDVGAFTLIKADDS